MYKECIIGLKCNFIQTKIWKYIKTIITIRRDFYMGNIGVTNVTFHDATITVSNGKEYSIGYGEDTLNVEINGTATSSTVVFEGKGLSGNWYLIQGVNLSTLDMATQTIGKGQMWQFDLTGLVGIRMRISAINSGNLSVVGRAVK
jgi:hypothetical protein